MHHHYRLLQTHRMRLEINARLYPGILRRYGAALWLTNTVGVLLRA